MRRLLIVLLLALIAGVGVAAHSDDLSSLQVAPAKLDFGTQPLNSESQPAAITIVNRAGSDVVLDEVISSGIDFIEKNGCGKQLSAGAQCVIQIVFKPVVSGERMGVVEILAADSAPPHFVALGGKGQ